MAPRPVLSALVAGLAALAASAAVARAAGATVLRDCADCPALALVPAGAFRMGSPPDEPGRQTVEGPQRTVSVARFALALHDVTVAEYGRFVAATGRTQSEGRCEWRRPTYRGEPFAQTPDDPVVCVTWADATAYAAWLAERTHRPYRLPTEAEWEYAARAGTTTARPWGPDADPDFANVGAGACCAPAVAGRDRWRFTSPVGSFPANRFGLYDMIGDVWQWTADCGDDPPAAGACATHIIRGGGWFHPPDMARSAARVADEADLRVADIGFRVARSLDPKESKTR